MEEHKESGRQLSKWTLLWKLPPTRYPVSASLTLKFLFEENGIRAWREFIVGPCSSLLYSKLEVVQEKNWIESPKGVGSTLQKYGFS